MRVLLIADRPSSQLLYTMVLSDEGHEVVVSTGQDAVEKAEVEGPDVVVTEVLTPETQTRTTIRNLKRMRPELPVIVFSTQDWRHRIREADAHLVKTSETQALVETVERVGSGEGREARILA